MRERLERQLHRRAAELGYEVKKREATPVAAAERPARPEGKATSRVRNPQKKFLRRLRTPGGESCCFPLSSDRKSYLL